MKGGSLMNVSNLSAASTVSSSRKTASTPQGGTTKRLTVKQSDQLQLSSQAMALLQAQTQNKSQKPTGLIALFRPQEKEESSDAVSEELKKLKLCAEIASRIRRGDKVPPKDLKYLIKHNAKLYMMAMASRQPNDDPKKWDSVLKDEESAESETSAVTEGESPSLSAAAAASAPSSGGESSASSESSQ